MPCCFYDHSNITTTSSFEILDTEKINRLEFLLWQKSSLSIPEILDLLALDAESDDSDEDQAQSSLNKDLLLKDINTLNSCHQCEIIKFNENYLAFNTENEAYIFCVIATEKGAGSIPDIITADEIGKIFEFVTLQALKEWKSTYAFERHENFHTDIHRICDKLQIAYSKAYCKNNVASNVQDGGVDIIGYCPTYSTACSRGHLYLIQCASGRNFRTKDQDINQALWSRVFTFNYTKIMAIVDLWIDNDLKFSKSMLMNSDEIFDRRAMLINIDTFKNEHPQEYLNMQKYIGNFQ